MKKMIFNEGGMPLYSDDIQTIHNESIDGIEMLGKALVKGNAVLYGMVYEAKRDHTSISAGAMMINGELIKFDGYLTGNEDSNLALFLEETSTDLTGTTKRYENGITYGTMTEKKLVARESIDGSGVLIYAEQLEYLRVGAFEPIPIALPNHEGKLRCCKFGGITKIAGQLKLNSSSPRIIATGLPSPEWALVSPVQMITSNGAGNLSLITLNAGELRYTEPIYDDFAILNIDLSYIST